LNQILRDLRSSENVAVTLRRDEPTGSPRVSRTPVPNSQRDHSDDAALADVSDRSGLITAERDGYIGGRTEPQKANQ